MNHSRITTYTTLVTRTLWRIEANLSRTPSLNDLAMAEGVSPFHLSRAFSLVIGQPVMRYVRARRLSEAARRLFDGDESVLTVALDAGYESHEGFTRAFREVLGVTPRAARETLPTHLQEPIVMQPKKKNIPKPEIVDFKGRTIIGRSGRFTPDQRTKIPAFWNSAAEEIGQRMYDVETYGVCHEFDDGSFDYLVGIADDGDRDGLDRVDLTPGRYAVFAHTGHISSIAETWAAIFDQWMPTSDEQPREAAEFEQYAADFDPAGQGGVSIWIPLKG